MKYSNRTRQQQPSENEKKKHPWRVEIKIMNCDCARRVRLIKKSASDLRAAVCRRTLVEKSCRLAQRLSSLRVLSPVNIVSMRKLKSFTCACIGGAMRW